MKKTGSFKFDWPLAKNDLSEEDRVSIFNEAYNVSGWKDILENRVYFFKRRFTESKDSSPKDLYFAEAYQVLLDLMVKSHKRIVLELEKVKKDKEK